MHINIEAKLKNCIYLIRIIHIKLDFSFLNKK